MHAEATFTVSDFAPAPVPAQDIATALPVGVATMTKTFTGAVEGRSQTVFTAAFDQATGIGTYVAMESFEGSIDGRRGTFNFVHAASTSGEDRSGEVFFIVPDSGTGELAGITGSGGIAIDADRTHRLTLDYRV